MIKPIVTSITSISIENDGTELKFELSGQNCFLSIDGMGKNGQYGHIKLNRQEAKLFIESIVSELNKSNQGKNTTRGIGENAE